MNRFRWIAGLFTLFPLVLLGLAVQRDTGIVAGPLQTPDGNANPRIMRIHVVASTEDGGSLPRMCLVFTGTNDFESIFIDPEGNTASFTSLPCPVRSFERLAQLFDGRKGPAYDLDLPEGDFIIGTNNGAPEGYYFKSFTAGGVDLLQEPLSITGKDASIQVTAVLARVKPVRVSGRAILTGRTPMRIRLTATMGKKQVETLVGPDGNFSLEDVSPGIYEVRFVLPGVLVAPTESRIAVHEKDVQELEFSMPTLREISGIAFAEGGGRLPAFRLLLGRDGRDLSPFTVPNRGGTVLKPDITDSVFLIEVAPEADGSFRFTVPEGKYSLACLTDVRSLHFAEVDLHSGLMNVAGNNPATLRIGLPPRTR